MKQKFTERNFSEAARNDFVPTGVRRSCSRCKNFMDLYGGFTTYVMTFIVLVFLYHMKIVSYLGN